MAIPKEFIMRQKEIAQKLILKDQFNKIELIGGADVTFGKKYAYGAVVVLSLPELRLIEKVCSKVKITLPYVPGFLSFREEPAIVAAYNLLKNQPDIILCDGQGIAHPKRAGLACALGITLNKPTIGCAKTRLIGEYTEPPKTKGSASLLLDNGEVIGYVLRTKDNTRPLFVSPGHMICLETARKLVLACCTKFRIPEPLRYAHTFSKLNKSV